MDKVQQFFRIKELWKQTSEAERPAIDRQLSDLLSNMTDAELDNLAKAIQARSAAKTSPFATV